MTNPDETYKNREPLTTEEIDRMLFEADKIEPEYFRLRAKAVIAIAEKFGKRRSEIASLQRSNVRVEKDLLLLTFTLRKKHKKGFFQYLKLLEKNQPDALDKPMSVLKEEWRNWTLTEDGYRVKEDKRTKGVSVDDKYARLIIQYAEHLDKHFPDSLYFFPSGTCVFGTSYVVRYDSHLSGRQLLRLIKPLDSTAWLHLFREFKAKEIAEQKGRTMDAIFDVKDTLDLEQENTALIYVRRFGVQIMKTEN